MQYRHLLSLTALLGAAAALAQQQGDLVDSPACRQALDALQAQEAAAPQPPGRLEASRRQAAAACLGAGAASRPLPQHLAQPPIGVAPIVLPPRLPALPAIPAPPPPLPRAQAPATVTSCDAAGCWASDGSHLQRVGPNLLGPRGMCTLQGAFLQCP